MRAIAARHFGALRNALRLLEQCYNEELSNKTPVAPDLEFPYPCSIPASARRQHFLLPLRQAITRRFAFVRHYSKGAHEFCASKGFAPILKSYPVDGCNGDDWRGLLPVVGFPSLLPS